MSLALPSSRLHVPAAGNGPFLESGGVLSIEAENYHAIVSPVNGYSWSPSTAQSGYSGASALYCGPSGGNESSPLTNSPYMTYNVRFESTGTKTLWIRCYSTSGGNDSIYGQVDGSSLQSHVISDKNVWYWRDKDYTVNITGDTTIKVYMRESDIFFDKLVISDTEPTGTGPAESARG